MENLDKTPADSFLTKLAVCKDYEVPVDNQVVGPGFFCEGKYFCKPMVGERFSFESDDPHAKGGLLSSIVKSIYEVGGSPDKLVLPKEFPPISELVFPSWPGQPGELREGDILFSTMNSIYWLGSLKAQGRS